MVDHILKRSRFGFWSISQINGTMAHGDKLLPLSCLMPWKSHALSPSPNKTWGIVGNLNCELKLLHSCHKRQVSLYMLISKRMRSISLISGYLYNCLCLTFFLKLFSIPIVGIAFYFKIQDRSRVNWLYELFIEIAWFT